MANDPAFLFYAGDYLRDTQCLSSGSQVAYDRIMCEHMRNICITQQQLNFFTKRLSDEEKEELLMVLHETDEGFQIKWVADSIVKRRAYSESRRNNRKGKKKKGPKKDVLTHVLHMDNENENVIVNKEEALLLWLNYRAEIKKPVKNEKTLSQLSARFEKESFDKVKWVVLNSIENQYQGLFWNNYDQKKSNESISPTDNLVF